MSVHGDGREHVMLVSVEEDQATLDTLRWKVRRSSSLRGLATTHGVFERVCSTLRNDVERRAFAAFAVWLCIGLYVYMCLPWGKEKHYYSFGEALYLMTQIITGVGYGDLVPYYSSGYLFVSFFTLSSALTCSTLLSALIQRVILAHDELHHDIQPVDAISSDSSGDELSPTREMVKHFKKRSSHYGAFIQALAAWLLCVAAGMLVFSNYCEITWCIPGHCCGEYNEESQCADVAPNRCKDKFEYKGRTYLQCTMVDSFVPWCSFTDRYESGSAKGVGWDECKPVHRMHEHLAKSWTITWPGSNPGQEPRSNNCTVTRATCCESKTYVQSFYMAVVTLTTVGFGDIVPSTNGGRWFSIAWMLVGVAAFANLAVRLTRLLMRRVHLPQLSSQSLHQMKTHPLIHKCMREHSDGLRNGVQRAEFILHTLLDQGLVSHSTVLDLDYNFSKLDLDKNGYLDDTDVGIEDKLS